MLQPILGVHERPGALQLKFNNLFNKLFSSLFFFILTRKNWRGGDGLLFKVGIVYGYYNNHVIALSL